MHARKKTRPQMRSPLSMLNLTRSLKFTKVKPGHSCEARPKLQVSVLPSSRCIRNLGFLAIKQSSPPALAIAIAVFQPGACCAALPLRVVHHIPRPTTPAVVLIPDLLNAECRGWKLPLAPAVLLMFKRVCQYSVSVFRTPCLSMIGLVALAGIAAVS